MSPESNKLLKEFFFFYKQHYSKLRKGLPNVIQKQKWKILSLRAINYIQYNKQTYGRQIYIIQSFTYDHRS